jgi:hypothetical protein
MLCDAARRNAMHGDEQAISEFTASDEPVNHAMRGHARGLYPAVNRLVAGSNPARGAKQKQRLMTKLVTNNTP